MPKTTEALRSIWRDEIRFVPLSHFYVESYHDYPRFIFVTTESLIAVSDGFFLRINQMGDDSPSDIRSARMRRDSHW